VAFHHCSYCFHGFAKCLQGESLAECGLSTAASSPGGVSLPWSRCRGFSKLKPVYLVWSRNAGDGW